MQTDPSRFPFVQVQTAVFGTSAALTGKSSGSQLGGQVPRLQTSFSVSAPEHPPFTEQVRVLVRVPSSQEAEQLDQLLHPPQVPVGGGHVCALQTSVSCVTCGPAHGPCAAVFKHVRLRSREPPPQVTVQLDQIDQLVHPNGAYVGLYIIL